MLSVRELVMYPHLICTIRRWSVDPFHFHMEQSMDQLGRQNGARQGSVNSTPSGCTVSVPMMVVRRRIRAEELNIEWMCAHVHDHVSKRTRELAPRRARTHLVWHISY